ncbi:putative transcription factor B3-Domain family [Helianthus debilis subsp. tardiflorus]
MVQVIPAQFSKKSLSSAVGSNTDVIRCINDMRWEVNFSDYRGTYAFIEGWEKVVVDLSLPEGSVLVLRKIEPHSYLLTPFVKLIPSQRCQPNVTMFTSISSLPKENYIESFCHVFNDQTVDNLRLPNKVARMSRIDVSLKLTIKNCDGVDTVVSFRPEKHGPGFRYVANEWIRKFTKPNGINAPQKCSFVYSPDAGKLILKKVSPSSLWCRFGTNSRSTSSLWCRVGTNSFINMVW